MYVAWTKHLSTPEEKKSFQQYVLSSKPILEHLMKLLDEMERELDSAETNPQNYSIPNWDYRQADNIGYRRALRHMKRLINLDQQKVSKDEPTI